MGHEIERGAVSVVILRSRRVTSRQRLPTARLPSAMVKVSVAPGHLHRAEGIANLNTEIDLRCSRLIDPIHTMADNLFNTGHHLGTRIAQIINRIHTARASRT
jgi:hypothetical protein